MLLYTFILNDIGTSEKKGPSELIFIKLDF